MRGDAVTPCAVAVSSSRPRAWPAAIQEGTSSSAVPRTTTSGRSTAVARGARRVGLTVRDEVAQPVVRPSFGRRRVRDRGGGDAVAGVAALGPLAQLLDVRRVRRLHLVGVGQEYGDRGGVLGGVDDAQPGALGRGSLPQLADDVRGDGFVAERFARRVPSRDRGCEVTSGLGRPDCVWCSSRSARWVGSAGSGRTVTVAA